MLYTWFNLVVYGVAWTYFSVQLLAQAEQPTTAWPNIFHMHVLIYLNSLFISSTAKVLSTHFLLFVIDHLFGSSRTIDQPIIIHMHLYNMFLYP